MKRAFIIMAVCMFITGLLFNEFKNQLTSETEDTTWSREELTEHIEKLARTTKTEYPAVFCILLGLVATLRIEAENEMYIWCAEYFKFKKDQLTKMKGDGV